MLHVIGCIRTTHDLRLVAIACVICLLASLTTIHMLGRARAARGEVRLAWVGTGGIAFGCGVWVTHFVAMLAYRADMPVAFDVRLTLLSLLLAIVGGWLASWCCLGQTRLASVAAGVVFGAAIGVMHFTGMMAFEVPGVVTYGAGDVAAAWIAGLVLAPLAMLRLRGGHRLQATLLLLLAVAGLHFIAMAAISIQPNGTQVEGLPTTSLALAVAAIGLLVLLASLGGALLDQHIERRAERETERFRRFADAMFEGLFFVDGDMVTDANLVLCQMLGRAVEEIVGMPLAVFVAPEYRGVLLALRGGAIGSAEVALLDAAGRRPVVDMLARPFGGGVGGSAVIAVRDASERKRAELRIQELAHTDPLTGLANRLLLHDRLAQALAMAERSGTAVALLYLDLDRFKAVNDAMGHHGGDRLLVEVATRLRASTPETDTVARLGGDEFIVMQPFTGQPGKVQAIAQRLVDALAQPYLIEGRALDVTASIGISLFPADSAGADLLLKQADLALFRAKQEGRGGYRFFEPAMDSKLRARRELEHDLRLALTNGEFRMCYQPVFSSARLTVAGYEALLRWEHPVRGNVPPGEFIPLAEECGAIGAIGQWVLETACAQAQTWPKHHMIAVNVSPMQFRNNDFVATVGDVLARTGLSPERLELEVTEGVMIDDTGRAKAVLRALKALGVRIALDDFGTGYSSLSYLRQFPFDRLKIDRSFVAELDISADAEAIVRCIIAMAQSLRLEVTAEGVETQHQLDLLQAMQCGFLQGYLLGRPEAHVLPQAKQHQGAAA